MDKTASPKVCIGLPVYNGGRYLRRAIESILSQTYQDLELVISDNGSIDKTQEICESFRSADPRVRYYRSPVNNGAMWNFNRCVELSSGKYFKWHAHDDILEPTFIERCVERLEAEPDAVLCHTLSKVVDEDLTCIEIYDPGKIDTASPRATARFGARLRCRRCIEIFGVIRRSALLNIKLFKSFVGADRAVLAELAIEGRFLSVPEYLFLNGDHGDRSTSLGRRPLDRLEFYAPVGKETKSRPIWSLYAAYFDIVKCKVPKFPGRVRCYYHMFVALFCRFNLLRLVVEQIWVFFPGIVDVVTLLRRALFAPKRALVRTLNLSTSD